MVAGLLEAESAVDQLLVISRQLDGTRIAQEVGRVEEVDVEGVALDPLGAVEEPSEGADLGMDRDVEEVLERVDRAHLVGHRADAADPGDDVDDLVRRPADDERLEVAGRLEDREVGLLDHAVADAQMERALALDAGQVLDLEPEVTPVAHWDPPT